MTSALLLMDLQAGIVDRFGADEGYTARIRDTAATARSAAIPVIWVTVGFREGHPEVSARNKSFRALATSGGLTGGPATEVHPALAPAPADIQVRKRRVSAFTGSDLDVVLRGVDADTLVLAGIATSGVVLSTVRQAADLDYRLVVLADGCLDADDEVHRVLTTKVFPRQADVTTAAEWVTTLG
ncbi:MAG TPA: isochorismatase family cysteine hydrolase [Acidimicrobiales bacterium]|jgi:nicotinamidase-related amidase|nr:isochorismatase family cysteine hydrolase [Acidimicrobiales bacterium]